MAYQDITFVCADRPKPQVTKDQGYTFTFKAYDGGTQVTPTSATITIKKPGGAALTTPVADAAVTISGSDMTYALTAGNADTLGANYTADVSYVVSGVTYKGRITFDVVLFPLRNVVIPNDLKRHHPDLDDGLFATETTARVYIEQAFEDVYQTVEAKGRRPFLVMNSEELRRPIEHLALAKFFFARTKREEDRWHGLYDMHFRQYNLWLQGLSLVYDENHSGTADGTDDEQIGGEEGRNLQVSWKI